MRKLPGVTCAYPLSASSSPAVRRVDDLPESCPDHEEPTLRDDRCREQGPPAAAAAATRAARRAPRRRLAAHRAGPVRLSALLAAAPGHHLPADRGGPP